jgi:putative ATP-grasp target RiPP
MLLNLITPLMIATSPVTVVVPAMDYDHGSQIATIPNGVRVAEEPNLHKTTYNSTRTYNAQGQPSDSDND